MRVGLGSGTTVAFLLPLLPGEGVAYFASSPQTERAARALGLDVRPFEGIDRLDLTIDGADQVAASGWLVKGGGAAHTREKILVRASDRFVVIVSPDKLVEELRPPVPLELLEFGLEATLRELAPVQLRAVPPSPDGGLIADYTGPIGDPAELAAFFAGIPGVVEHGLFAPSLVDEVMVGRA